MSTSKSPEQTSARAQESPSKAINKHAAALSDGPKITEASRDAKSAQASVSTDIAVIKDEPMNEEDKPRPVRSEYQHVVLKDIPVDTPLDRWIFSWLEQTNESTLEDPDDSKLKCSAQDRAFDTQSPQLPCLYRDELARQFWQLVPRLDFSEEQCMDRVRDLGIDFSVLLESKLDQLREEHKTQINALTQEIDQAAVVYMRARLRNRLLPGDQDYEPTQTERYNFLWSMYCRVIKDIALTARLDRSKLSTPPMEPSLMANHQRIVLHVALTEFNSRLRTVDEDDKDLFFKSVEVTAQHWQLDIHRAMIDALDPKRSSKPRGTTVDSGSDSPKQHALATAESRATKRRPGRPPGSLNKKKSITPTTGDEQGGRSQTLQVSPASSSRTISQHRDNPTTPVSGHQDVLTAHSPFTPESRQPVQFVTPSQLRARSNQDAAEAFLLARSSGNISRRLQASSSASHLREHAGATCNGRRLRNELPNEPRRVPLPPQSVERGSPKTCSPSPRSPTNANILTRVRARSSSGENRDNTDAPDSSSTARSPTLAPDSWTINPPA